MMPAHMCASYDPEGFDIFKNFGFQSGKDVDKFADFGDVARSENGLYYITKGANSFISASVVERGTSRWGACVCP